MVIVDTHAHLYSDNFKGEVPELIQRAIDNNVSKILLPNIDSESIDGMHQLCIDYPNVCYAMMGIHPCHVKSDWKTEWELMKVLFKKHNYVAVGEIGIDLYWDKTTLDIQVEAFKVQVEFAYANNLPIVIHARESLDIIIGVLQKMELQGLRGVFHCFSGNTIQTQQIIDLGMYIGVGGVYTFKKSLEIREAVLNMGIHHLLLETDSPYLSPEPKRGKRNEPSYTLYIAERLAKEFGLSVEEVAARTTENAHKLFDFI